MLARKRNKNGGAIKQKRLEYTTEVHIPTHTRCCAATAGTAQAAQTGPAAEPVRECVCGRKEALNGCFLEGWDLW